MEMSEPIGRISRIAVAGWRGMPYLEFDLEGDAFTALVGEPGAGKSTVGMVLLYALMPDRLAMDVRPLTEIEEAKGAGTDTLAGRIAPISGYAYLMLDVVTREGARLVIGLHCSAVDGSARFQPIYLKDVPAHLSLQDCLRLLDGDEESYPDLNELAASLAQRGVTLVECKGVREYCAKLFEAGLLPCDLSDGGDRRLYGQLQNSCFRGGVSKEVAKNLKEYILPEATRLPESVDRLQRCANSVTRTRSALDKAEQQLLVLEATHGLGKRIVCHAISHAQRSLDKVLADTELAQRHLDSSNQARDAFANAMRQLKELIETALESKKAVASTYASLLHDVTEERQRLSRESLERVEATTIARAAIDQFNRGKKEWSYWSATEYGADVEQIQETIERSLTTSDQTNWALSQALEQNELRVAVLRGGLAETPSTTLATALNAPSLASYFEEATSEEALQTEAALGGLVDGLVGVSLESIAELKDDERYPDTFWVLPTAPQSEAVRHVGDWLAVPLANGFVVTSKRRKLTLGSQAREREISRLKEESEDLSAKIRAAQKASRTLKDQLGRLHQHLADIRMYLSLRESGDRLNDALQHCLDAQREVDVSLKRTDDRIQSLIREQGEKTSELDRHREGLDADLRENSTRHRDMVATIQGLEARVSELEARQLAEKDGLQAMEHVLGSSWAWLRQQSSSIGVMSHDQYIASQSKALAELGHGLAGEHDARLDWLHKATPTDSLSLCAIWAPLQGIVHDLLSVEVIEEDGADVLAAMKDRRRKLANSLEQERSELRTEATTLYSTIDTEVRKQERRIRRMSSFGHGMKFGNVTGIRIEPRRRKELLDRLLSVTAQLDLFVTQSDAPLDVQLSELFNKELSSPLSAPALLDYRSYMEVVIEAERGGEWENATGLSGGEAIGGGLAISLMLVRFLAQRDAQSKPTAFGHVAVVDEIQRLNGPGQALIAEFAREQGIQVLATATGLEAEFPLTMYVMSRRLVPEELVFVRKVIVGGPRGRTH
jgi:chromosome condensin MukBEF ATPase and DNA-binding subunit MukB